MASVTAPGKSKALQDMESLPDPHFCSLSLGFEKNALRPRVISKQEISATGS